MASVIHPSIPSESRPGRFGLYGGRYVPETLMAALLELEREYEAARADAAFQAELDLLLKDFAGRPTPLYFAKRMTEDLGGAQSTSSAKICSTPAPTRSTTPWDRDCSRGGWVSIASLPRPAPASTA